jgi:hypothetical protein
VIVGEQTVQPQNQFPAVQLREVGQPIREFAQGLYTF